MKKLITLIVLVGLGLITFAQVIPNSTFQTWDNEGSFENPQSWSSSNITISGLSIIPVSKSNDAYIGDYSAQLTTQVVPFLNYHIPGIITLADINISMDPLGYSISGGLALQENVSVLNGKYKYEGVENDSAVVLIYNFKHDEGSDYDTIGYGVTYLHDASEWTSFTVNMNNINNHVPDTFNVIITSSSSADFNSGAGSVLLVDSLSIETNTGIFDLFANTIDVNVYPNPANNYVQFNTSSIETNRQINIYDVSGKLLNTHNFNQGYAKINIENLPIGIYTYNVTKQNSVLNRGSFIKRY